MLTNFQIDAAKPRERIYRMSDGRGLALQIEPNGSKLWRFRYHFNGREKMLSLGSYPDVSLAKARTRREDARTTLADGIDPSRKRETDKAVALVSARNTFGLVADEYIERLGQKGCGPSTLSKNRWLLEDLASQLRDRPIAEITPPEVLAVLQRIEKSGRRDTARRLRGVMGAVFRHAIVTLRAATDPTYPLRGALLAPQVTHRAAITDEKQLGALMIAIDEYDGWPTLRAALLLLALTMTRPGDVRLMQKSEIVFPKALWRIPAERMKMRKPHDVPLSRQALAVIREMWELTPGSGLLLPSIRSNVKPLSENAMNSALRRMGYTKEEVTAHGFRSSASTIQNERHMAHQDVIEAALAHQEENDVRAAYNRATYLSQRVKLMQEWADLLDELRGTALQKTG